MKTNTNTNKLHGGSNLEWLTILVSLILGLGSLTLQAAPTGFRAWAETSGQLNKLSMIVHVEAGTEDAGHNGQVFVAAQLANGQLYAYSSKDWKPVKDSSIPPAQNVILGEHSVEVLLNMNVQALNGAILYAGYGTGAEDMLARKAYQRIYTIGAPLTGAVTAGDFLTFSINVQDFSYPDLSAATISRLVALHEAYQLPVDIYLSDTMLDIYRRDYPELLQTLTTSSFVGLNYHIRPPKPYYNGFDWDGITRLSQTDQVAEIVNYETRVTDPVTGQPGAAGGGYAALRALPNAYPGITAAFQVEETLLEASAEAFKSLGATWTLAHTGGVLNLGESARGLYIRPEHFDLLLFQHPGESAATIIAEAFAKAHEESGARAPFFVGAKMHDNDFFADRSAWLTVYMDGSRRPNWNPDKKANIISEADQQAQWTIYEAALQYANSKRTRLGIANSTGIAQLRKVGTPTLHVSGTMHIESNFSTWPNVDALIAFFQRATAAGKASNKTHGMRWSIGADIVWLQNEQRAGEVIKTLSALGVEWDIHAHNVADRIRNAERIVALGGIPNQVVSGLLTAEIDGLRTAQTGSTGYVWQPAILWGLTVDDGHSGDSDDLAAGLWRPDSSADWRTHDPGANLVAIGNGGHTLAAAQTLADSIATGSYVQPVYSVTLNVQPKTLKIVGSTDGINEIEAWANSMGTKESIQWSTLTETAAAWQAAGALPSRVNID